MDSITLLVLTSDLTKVHLSESCLSTPPSKPIKESMLSFPIPKKISK